MKKFFYLSISWILGLGILIYILGRIGIKDILKGFSHFNPLLLFLGLGVFFLSIVISVWRWNIILKTKNYHVPFLKVLVAKFADFSVSYITPMSFVGGEGIRAYIIKKEANVSFIKGLSTVLIDKLVELIIGTILLILSALIIVVKIASYQLSIMVIIVSIIAVFGLIFLYSRIRTNEKFLVSLIQFLRLDKIKYIKDNTDDIHEMEDEIYSFFRNFPRDFLYTILLGIGEIFLYLILFEIVAISLGYHISFFYFVIIRSLYLVISLIPIPGALGINEGGFGFAFKAIGLEIHSGVVFSLVLRCFYLTAVAIGLVLLSHFGIKLSRAVIEDKVNNNDDNHNKENTKNT